MVIQRLPLLLFLTAVLLLGPNAVFATQGHAGVEGVYVHQASHVFFCISMGILIFWLRARGLMEEPGWRYIGYAAFLFILWSADAFLVHFLDEQLQLVETRRIGNWWIQLTTSRGKSWLAFVYFFAKLDHLLCVPAMAFLYMGLRRQVAAAVKDCKEARRKEPA